MSVILHCSSYQSHSFLYYYYFPLQKISPSPLPKLSLLLLSLHFPILLYSSLPPPPPPPFSSTDSFSTDISTSAFLPYPSPSQGLHPLLTLPPPPPPLLFWILTLPPLSLPPPTHLGLISLPTLSPTPAFRPTPPGDQLPNYLFFSCNFLTRGRFITDMMAGQYLLPGRDI